MIKGRAGSEHSKHTRPIYVHVSDWDNESLVLCEGFEKGITIPRTLATIFSEVRELGYSIGDVLKL